MNRLKNRFFGLGLLLFILAPFLLVFLILYFFFRYAQEYHKNPSSVGARQYSPLARWKFREFNELLHVFQHRLNSSYPKAIKYLGQFPQQHLIIYAKFISFICGSFAAVLLISTILNQDLLHDFEITPGYSSFFYISVFGGIAASLNSLIPHESEIYEPEKIGQELILDTHYFPPEWHGQLHSRTVYTSFSRLFPTKITLYCQEILSILTAPFILCFSLPSCSESIIDFFREFSVHVDSIGYVCSFGVFDFKRNGNTMYGAPNANQESKWTSKAGKMESSFLSFKVQHPEWDPGMHGSTYLASVMNRYKSSSGNHGLAESIMGNSELESSVLNGHQNELKRDLYKLLNAIYESNKTMV